MQEAERRRVAAVVARERQAPAGWSYAAVMKLLGAFADEGKYAEMAEAIATFRSFLPGSLPVIEKRLAASVRTHIGRSLGSSTELIRFERDHPEWTDRLLAASANPQDFASLLHSIRAEVQRMRAEGASRSLT